MLINGKYVILDPAEADAGYCEEQAILVRDNLISEIGPFGAMREKYPEEEVIGNGRQLLMPGLIDAHNHGTGLSHAQRGIRFDYLENSLLDFATALTLTPETNSMLNAVRHIRNGCTTLHQNDNCVPLDPNMADTCRRKIGAYRKTGIRLGFSMGVRNKNILALEDESFLASLPEPLRTEAGPRVNFDRKAVVEQYMDSFDKVYTTENNGRVRVFYGPNWVQGSTDDFLQLVKEKADAYGKIPIHLHCLQTPVQKAFGLRNYGKSLVGHLDDLGLTDTNLVLGHAVFLSEEDIVLLAGRGATVTHHASCNLIMRNGIAPVYRMLQEGLNVALGIDEKGINDDEDPIMEMRLIYFLHRCPGIDLNAFPAITPETVLRIATVNSALPTGFAGQTGALRVGMAADMILVDMEEILDNPWYAPGSSIPWLFVRRGLGRHVNTVIIDGKIVMKERKILTINVDELYEDAREQASRGRTPNQLAEQDFLYRIKPYYQKWYNQWVKELEFEPYYYLNSRT